jgi:FkbM family methyltransferase
MTLFGTPLGRVGASLAMRHVHALWNRLAPARRDGLQYRRFHGQFGEDRWIFEHLALPDRGVFVDVGAGHPVALSNTYFFERNGWTGLCIDADPLQYEQLRRRRLSAEWAAVARTEGEVDLYAGVSPTYSTTVPRSAFRGFVRVPLRTTIRVPAVRLETLLRRHGIDYIDLMSIDVEGTEIEVWESFDHETHRPRVVIIEFSTFGLADNGPRIADYFARLPYDLVHTTYTNFIFVRRDRPLGGVPRDDARGSGGSHTAETRVD